MTQFLIGKIGKEKFDSAHSFLKKQLEPMKILEEHNFELINIIGEENIDCIAAFKMLLEA